MSETANENTKPQRRLYFAIILLGPIWLLIGWVTFKIGLEHRFAADENAGYQGFIAAPAPEVLFIGSSHTRQSYDIAAVEAATGRTAYALAYGALDLNLIKLLLEDLLPDPAHRPKILVLEAYSAKLARKPELDDPRLFFDVPPELKLKLLANYLQIHPDLSACLDLFDLVVNRGTDQLLTYPLNSRILANLSYKGAYRGHVISGVSESEFRSFQAELAGSEPNPIQLGALRDIIALCKQYRIQLVLAESPMPRPISARPEIQSLKAAFRAVCSETNLPYLDGDDGFPIDDPSLFADASHLSTAGRSLYTTNLVARFGVLLIKGASSHNPHSGNNESRKGMATNQLFLAGHDIRAY